MAKSADDYPGPFPFARAGFAVANRLDVSNTPAKAHGFGEDVFERVKGLHVSQTAAEQGASWN